MNKTAGTVAQKEQAALEIRGPIHIPAHVFIIAEVGINHNGDIETAKQLIDAARQAGCDAVKFQKRTIDKVYTREFLDSPRESPWGKTQRAQKEGLEFGKKEFDEIDRHCKKAGLQWSASAWDIDSQRFLQQYDLPFNKVASPILTHLSLVEEIAKEGRHTYVSTGMSDFAQIDRAVEVFRKHRCPFTLMHCVSVYPAEDSELNIFCLRTLRERYGCPVGYSGHEVGVFGPLVAVMLGATAIERHITLNRSMYGSDQSASLEPRGLEYMVRDIRSLRSALGAGEKTVSPKESANSKKLRTYWHPENSQNR
ncbi:MAG: N-acetylneuraminate synthase family protein [Elusimicrobia bacterium]|nr:N-acetylneuraminate synthase family protein [Elusimicrobiota bacterium]